MIIDTKMRALLIEKAEYMTKQSYAPYSKFHVGSAVLSKQGNIYTGCNVENTSYGLAVCAERNAIFAGIAAEGLEFEIAAIAVSSNPKINLTSPCGACRQVMAEFGKSFLVIFPKDGTYQDFLLEDLLPLNFLL